MVLAWPCCEWILISEFLAWGLLGVCGGLGPLEGDYQADSQRLSRQHLRVYPIRVSPSAVVLYLRNTGLSRIGFALVWCVVEKQHGGVVSGRGEIFVGTPLPPKK